MKEYLKKGIFILIGLAIGIVGTIILLPKKVSKLSDGSEEVVSMGNVRVSANEYYSAMKNEDRLNILLRHLNVAVLKEKYSGIEEEAKTYAEERYESFKQQMELYNTPIEEGLKQYGYHDKDDFIRYVSEDYYLNKYYKDYLSNTIKEDELKADYDANYFATKHIYVFSSSNKNDLSKVKNKLDKGTNVSKVLNSYSTVSYNDFDFSFLLTVYGEEIYNQVKDTKVGKTTSLSNTQMFGNYFIYVASQEEAKSFETVKSDMIDEKIAELEETDPNLTYKVVFALHDEYHIDFKDEVLKEKYEELKKEYNK